MVENLFKLASRFHKLSQDPMPAVKAAVEAVVEQIPDTTVKTISVIDNDVKVDVDITNSASKGVTREQLEKLIRPAVQKLNPAFQVTVTVSISSEETLPKQASKIRQQFAKMHKLADCLPGDPMCPDIGDFKAPPVETKPNNPPKPPPKPPVKPDTNKADDGLPADILNALDNNLKSLKGSLRLDINGKAVTVRYNFEKIKAGNAKVKDAVASVIAPLGYRVVECFGESRMVPNYT